MSHSEGNPLDPVLGGLYIAARLAAAMWAVGLDEVVAIVTPGTVTEVRGPGNRRAVLSMGGLRDVSEPRGDGAAE